LDIFKFWNGVSLSDDFLGEVQIPPVSAALVKRLGIFPFWRGRERFFDALEPIYVRGSTIGIGVFLGERSDLEISVK
jgi:hypothetical protein